MKISVFFACIALSISNSVFADSDFILVSLPEKDAKFTLKDLKAQLKVITITINDPVYKKRMTYDGFRLSDVLTLAGFKDQATGDEIVFTAKDGYSPNTSFDSLRKH